VLEESGMPDQVRHGELDFTATVSFSDRPALTAGKKAGCLAILVVEIFIIGFAMEVAALGDCAPKIDGTGCESSNMWKLIAFPGSLIFALIFNFVFIRWLMRSR
jgi:hypothetical protein